MSEQRKRIQIRNSLEEKSLKEKIRRYNREQNYVDKELRQIILAKQSLLRSLRSINLDQDSSSAGRTCTGTKSQNSGKEQASTGVAKETYNASQFCSSGGTNNVDADVKTLRNGRKVSPHQKLLKTSFAGQDPELPSLTTFRRGIDTRNVMSPPSLPGNTKTNSSLDLTGCSKPGKDGASNRSLGKKHSEKQTETKSCLHVQSKHLPRKESKVRFSVPLITKQLETEKIWEISDGGKKPSKLNSENSKAYRTSSRFESNSEALEKIKVRSKFYQVGSVALATAIFKSASVREAAWEKTSSSDKKQVLRDELQKKSDGQEKKAEKDKPNEQRRKIVRSKSGYLAIPPKEKKILVRRISSASQAGDEIKKPQLK